MQQEKGWIDGVRETGQELKHSGAKAKTVVFQVSLYNSRTALRSQDQGKGAH